MDIQSIWVVILAIATPLAGVVGFGVQLRNVKKLRLENEKLELELQMMREEIKNGNSHIVRATNEEVMRINDIPMFSRSSSSPISSDEIARSKPRLSTGEVALIVGFLFFVAYLIYDLYRLGSWVWSKF